MVAIGLFDYFKKRCKRLFLLLCLLHLFGFVACSGNDESDAFNSVSKYLVLNEVVSKDSQGGNDWIELHLINDGDVESVNLNEYSLMDSNSAKAPRVLPDITLLPGEYVVVYATEQEPRDGSYWVDFKLGSDDLVALFHDGKRIDTLDWTAGAASSGYSYGRVPDQSGRKSSLIPTKGFANKNLSTTPLVVNEIVASTVTGAEINSDWIEIYNSGDSTVDLSGYSISDSGGLDNRELLPNIELGGKQFLTIFASPQTIHVQIVYQVTLKLGRGGDSVSLYNPGKEVVSYLKWEGGEAEAGVSYGHYPDGAGEVQTLSPTLGASNQLTQ